MSRMYQDGSAMRGLSRLALGCARIGSFNNPMSTRDTQRLLELALASGITTFDTADIYGQGDSERAIGRLLKHNRDSVFVVTKVGQAFSTAMRLVRPIKPILKPIANLSAGLRTDISARRAEVMTTDFTPTYLRVALDRCLRRLQLTTIDALLLHSPRAADLRDDVQDVLQAAQAAGKIRHYGVACDDAPCLEAALRWPGVRFVEIPPPIFERASDQLARETAERDLKGLVREVVRYRGHHSPRDAVLRMLARSDIAAVVAGTTSPAHLAELAQIARSPSSVVSRFRSTAPSSEMTSARSD